MNELMDSKVGGWKERNAGCVRMEEGTWVGDPVCESEIEKGKGRRATAPDEDVQTRA